MWKYIAQNSLEVLAAKSFAEALERGLRIACYLSRADLAYFHRADGGDIWALRAGESLALEQSRPTPGKFLLQVPVGDGRASLTVSSDAQGFDELRPGLECWANLLWSALQRLEIESAQRESGERYRNFVSESSEGVWRCELKKPMPIDLPVEQQIDFVFKYGVMAECNPAMARMYGFRSGDEIVGAPLTYLLVPEDPRNHLYLESFVRNGYRLRDAESVEKDRNGETRYFLNNLVGIRDGNYILGAWGTQSDITAFKEMESRLTNAAKEAATASQAKSAFLANISHEIRTPLGVILGFTDLALDTPGLSPETVGHLTAIRRNGQQVTEILGEILDLSKIEASRMEIEEIRFQLVPMLNEMIANLSLRAREKGISLSFEAAGPLPQTVKSDPTRLRQILTNLIGNALKFTDQGFVKLGARTIGEPKLGAPLALEFIVSDSGIGIPGPLREKLFQPFVQAEASTTRRYGGTGLGLVLSKKLANALGGDLMLRESQGESGATFVFSVAGGLFEGKFAADERAPTVLRSASVDDGEVFVGKKILLVEDSEDNQVLIKHYLNAVGIDVDIANNGFEGLERIKADEYDLVVLDIQMPGMDGHQVAKSMREKGFNEPIVALTAHAFKEDRDKAFLSGFSEYLTKPINRSALLKTLSDRLGDHSPSR